MSSGAIFAYTKSFIILTNAVNEIAKSHPEADCILITEPSYVIGEAKRDCADVKAHVHDLFQYDLCVIHYELDNRHKLKYHRLEIFASIVLRVPDQQSERSSSVWRNP